MITASLASLVGAVPDTTVSAGPLFQLLLPYILSVASVIVTAAITWAAAAFQRWTGVKLDQAHREALHSAAMTGLTAAFSRLGATANSLTIDTKSAAIAQAITWMEKSVPGAMARFKMTPDQLAEFVESKIGLLATGSPGTAQRR